MPKNKTSIALGQQLYGDDFYDNQVSESYESGKVFAKHLWQMYRPNTVVDFGCGRGAWLKAFKEQGSTELVGLDGPWNQQENMIDQTISFCPTDLNVAAVCGLGDRRFDLVISLEVAEHLRPELSPRIVTALCTLSDVAMFGAAFLFQPGTDHINTRLHSFWATLFAENGYKVYDYFRPAMWGRKGVPYWYQQNTFLYVRDGHPLQRVLSAAGLTHVPDHRFALLDQVHPTMLELFAKESGVSRVKREIRTRLRERLPGSVLHAARKIRRAIS